MRNKIINSIAKIWNKADIPFLNYVRFNILVQAYRFFPLIGHINYSRLVEWQFVLQHLPQKPAKILDVGSNYSLFPYKLKASGHEVHCLDQNSPNRRYPKSIQFHQANLVNININSNIFDVVSCISVIEHIGLGKYDDPKFSEGDIKGIKEMIRILKPNGLLIITTNICRQTCIYNHERFYGRNRIKELMSLGIVGEIEYRYFNGRRWVICPERQAFDRDASNFGLAMFVLKKAP